MGSNHLEPIQSRFPESIENGIDLIRKTDNGLNIELKTSNVNRICVRYKDIVSDVIFVYFKPQNDSFLVPTNKLLFKTKARSYRKPQIAELGIKLWNNTERTLNFIEDLLYDMEKLKEIRCFQKEWLDGIHNHRKRIGVWSSI